LLQLAGCGPLSAKLALLTDPIKRSLGASDLQIGLLQGAGWLRAHLGAVDSRRGALEVPEAAQS